MKLIVGLGNPGDAYQGTYHNLGYAAIETIRLEYANQPWQRFSGHSEIADFIQKEEKIILLRPLTFMNESGRSVGEVARYFHVPTEDLWVIHDDLDLPLGQIKLDANAGAAGHRGVQSIIDAIGGQSFKRFRCGTGRPPAGQTAESFVLSHMPPSDFATTVAKVVQLVRQTVADGFERTQTLANRN